MADVVEPVVAEDGASLEAEHVAIRLSAVGRVEAGDLSVDRGAVGAARTRQLTAEQGAVGAVMADRARIRSRDARPDVAPPGPPQSGAGHRGLGACLNAPHA